MAIRFDIDKYNKIRDSYLAYIRDGKVDTQLSPLYETYKAYWANDTEVKEAEQQLKLKREQDEEERWRIRELRKELRKEELQKEQENRIRQQEAKQQLKATKSEIYSRYGRYAPPKMRNPYAGRIYFALTNDLWVELNNEGYCTNLDKIKDYITRTRSKSILKSMLVNLRDGLFSHSVNNCVFYDIEAIINKQQDILTGAFRNRKIASSGHNHFFEVADQKTAGVLLGTAASTKEKTKKHNKHSSVWTIGSAGIPGTGKRY